MKVIASSASRESCTCGSWLKHWERFSEQTTQYCQVIGCLNRDVVGALVQIAGGYDKNGYVYPMCRKHSRSVEELEISETFALVPAEPRLTCGPKS